MISVHPDVFSVGLNRCSLCPYCADVLELDIKAHVSAQAPISAIVGCNIHSVTAVEKKRKEKLRLSAIITGASSGGSPELRM